MGERERLYATRNSNGNERDGLMIERDSQNSIQWELISVEKKKEITIWAFNTV